MRPIGLLNRRKKENGKSTASLPSEMLYRLENAKKNEIFKNTVNTGQAEWLIHAK